MAGRWRRYATGRDHVRGAGALTHRLRRLSWLDRLDEARAFIELHMRESGLGNRAFQRRWSEVRRDLLRHSHYDHSPEELSFGAKLAWRNHAGCIGRLFWDSLIVRDRRRVSEPDAIFHEMCRHLEDATGDGRIRSIMSIFPPVRPGGQPAYVESGQMIQYAGYLDREGQVLGDRRNIEMTRIAQSLGWCPPQRRGAFDILPVLMRDSQERRRLFELPDGIAREVPIAHPDCHEIAALGLRWYAVPVVSDMILTIGSIDYPCAPFNGFYMCTEIASRDFADRGRYDLLPHVARGLGLKPEGRESLWKDMALTELNRAVLHSYRSAGVTMVDHHTASDQFMQFTAREEAAGRRVSAEWTWIVPPQASSACEVFHSDMTNLHAVPNFYRSRSTDGERLMPRTACGRRSRFRRVYERVRREARQPRLHA